MTMGNGHTRIWSGRWVAVLALCAGAAHGGAPDATNEGEWPYYAGDAWSTKYAPLDQITAGNFETLEQVWRWTSIDSHVSLTVPGGEWLGKSDDVFGALQEADESRWRSNMTPRLANLKATPLMVDGLLYMVTALYQAAAIDAKTGETVWVFNPKSYEVGTPTMSIFWNHRGAAYWDDGEDGRIYWGTGDAYVYAVNAKTGRPCDDFGDHGRVDLMDGLPRANRDARDHLNALLYSCASPPMVVNGVLIAGGSVADRRITKEAVPGWVRAYDATTGAPKWDFHTVPLEGEPGVETWEDDSWKYTGNSNVWTQISADPELGIVYLPTGTPTNDFYGGHRLGNNLYAECILALAIETGERLWHFQTVHHGLWDYDNPAAPNLVDITVDGKTIPAVVQVTKQGFCFVFDRKTGEPVWPIEERPVPLSTIPGEVTSATQPFPTKPPAFEYQGVTEDDLIDFTPELRAAAKKALEGYTIGPLFTPPTLTENGNQGTIQRPSLGGGANWESAACDPETGLLYVTSANSFSIAFMYEPDPKEGATLRYTHGGRGQYPRGPEGLPLFKPPYSRITAIDLNKGEIVWTAAHGNGDAIRNHPLLKELNLPPVGGDGRGSPLVTKTLLIVPMDPGGRAGDTGELVALNKTTGERVGTIPLPDQSLGAAMTYMLDGRQYIALTVKGNPPSLVAYALPEGDV